MRTFSIKFAFVLVFCSAMLFAFGQNFLAPVTILEDDFEGADLSAYVNTLGGTASGLYDADSTYYRGTQSLFMDGDEAGHLTANNLGPADTSAGRLTMEYWLYDTLTDPFWGSGRCGPYISSWGDGSWGAGGVDQIVFYGPYHTSSATNMAVRIVSGSTGGDAQGWQATSFVRAEGWVKLTAVLFDGDIEFFADDGLVLSNTYNAGPAFNVFRLGSPAGSVFYTTGFYFDDLSLVYEEVAPEPWVPVEYAFDVATPDAGAGSIGDVLRLALDSNNRLYLTHNGGNIWYTDNPLDPSPTYEVLVTGFSAVNGVQGLAIDADDNVYFSGDNAPDGLIGKYSAAGVEEWFHVLAGQRVTSCTLLSTGELLVTSFGGTFYLFDPADGTPIGAGQQITGLANFVRDMVSTPDDTVFVTQTGAVKKVAGGNAGDLAAYEAVDFGAASYEASSFQVRPSVIYLDDYKMVLSSNWPDTGADTAVPSVFIQNAGDGSLEQTINDFVEGWRTAGLAWLVDGVDSYLFVAGFDSVMRVYTQEEEIHVEDWELYQY